MTHDEVRKALQEKLAVPLWPTAGTALGLGRNSAYKAASQGQIPGCYRILDKYMVATAPLRAQLGMNKAA
jgi:hypothetical protein